MYFIHIKCVQEMLDTGPIHQMTVHNNHMYA